MFCLWSFSYTTTCLHRCFNSSRIDAHFCPFAGYSADLKDLLQCPIVSPAAETAVHGLVRAESRREITPSCTTAGKPHNSVQMCSDILLWTACSMKKIVYIHHGGNQGGAPRSLKFLIQKLDKSRYEPYVICMSDRRNISFFEEAGAKVIFDETLSRMRTCVCDRRKNSCAAPGY